MTREQFDSLVYSSLWPAIEELKARQNDAALGSYVDGLLTHGLPEPMKGKKSIVLFRHVATPNYEVIRFLNAADALADFQPLILEYTHDRFNNRNEWKFSLAKLRFHKGHNRLGESIFENRTIIDINASNNVPIREIRTEWGEPLHEFHHRLFGTLFPQFTDAPYDLSEWLHVYGPTAKEYYKAFLSLFLKDGILFENFLFDGKEASFTDTVILPALEELRNESGYKPLIIPLEPTTIEGDQFWLSHPIDHLTHISNANNNHTKVIWTAILTSMHFLTKMGFLLILALIGGIVWYRYDQYVIAGNFILHADTACDPQKHSCFVLDCIPGETPDCEIMPYQKVDIIANQAPTCLAEHLCTDFSCAESQDCSITYCSNETLEEGEVCTTNDTDVQKDMVDPAPQSTKQ